MSTPTNKMLTGAQAASLMENLLGPERCWNDWLKEDRRKRNGAPKIPFTPDGPNRRSFYQRDHIERFASLLSRKTARPIPVSGEPDLSVSCVFAEALPRITAAGVPYIDILSTGPLTGLSLDSAFELSISLDNACGAAEEMEEMALTMKRAA